MSAEKKREFSTTSSVVQVARAEPKNNQDDAQNYPTIVSISSGEACTTGMAAHLLTESQTDNIIQQSSQTEESITADKQSQHVQTFIIQDSRYVPTEDIGLHKISVVNSGQPQHLPVNIQASSTENICSRGDTGVNTVGPMSHTAAGNQDLPVSSSQPLTQAVPGINKDIYKCSLCDYCSHNKHYLKQHVDLVHNAERPFKCPFCDYAGKRSHSLKEHLVVHSNNRPYECGYCNATFRKKGHLTNHIKMHTTQKVTCGLCSSEFSERSELHKHIKSQHPSDQWYACDVCDYVTLTRTSIIMHMHTHCNPKTYMCSVCKFTSLHKAIMTEHMECHSEGTFQEITTNPDSTPLILLRCSECGFTTLSKDVLKYHMWEHLSKSLPEYVKGRTLDEFVKPLDTGVKNISDSKLSYKCSDCSYVCNEAVMFITHMLSQHKPKTSDVNNTAGNIVTGSLKVDEKTSYTHDVAGGFYRCTACGYTSEHQRTIKSHMWRHSGTSSIDYPMFQNGPLSIYEDTPIGLPQKVTTNSVEIVKTPVGAVPARPKENPPQNVEESPENPNQNILKASVITSGQITLQRSVPKALEVKPGSCLTRGTTVPTESPTHVVDSENNSSLVTIPESMLDIPTVTIKVPSNVVTSQKSVNVHRDKAQFYIVNSDGSHTPVRKESLVTDSVMQADYEEANEEVEVHYSEEVNESMAKEGIPKQPDTSSVTNSEAGYRELGGDTDITLVIQNEQEENIKEVKFNVLINRDDEMVTNDIPVAAQCIVVSSEEAMNERSDSEFSRQTCMSDGSSLSSSPTEKKTFTANTKVDNLSNYPDMEAGKMRSEIISLLLKAKEQGSTLSPEDIALATTFFHQLGIPHIPQQLLSNLTQQKTEKEQNEAKMQPTENSAVKRVVEEESKELADKAKRAKLANVLVENVSTSYPTVKLMLSGNGSRAGSPKQLVPSSGQSSVSTSPIQDKEKPDFSLSNSDTGGQSSPDHTDEAITLLSLLKKGPNINPACPPADVATSPKVSTRPKSGISSSLLAVIEHLRERAKSESDGEDVMSVSSLSSGKKTSKKGRKRKKNFMYDDGLSIEDFHQIETMTKGVNSQYRCKLCHYTSNSPAFMKAHVKMTHKAKQPFECSLCDYIAESTGDLQKHTLQHCKARVYQCKSCVATFGYKSQLRAHMRIHSDVNSLSSGEAIQMSSVEPNQDNLNERPEKSRKYYCPDCQEGFTTKSICSEHVGKCSKARTYFVCQVCGYKALNESQFIEHAKAEHMSQEQKHKCEFCDFHSTSEFDVTEHQKNHIKELNLVCEMCGFTAISVRSLKSHMKRHTNDKRFVQQPLEQYKCNLCGYLCHHLPSLKSHMWRHSSDTNYSYEVTNEIINAAMERDSFSDEEKNAVESISDMKSKSGNKKHVIQNLITFRCCQCGFETGDKKSLNSHMIAHTEIIQRTQEINRARILGNTERSTEENG